MQLVYSKMNNHVSVNAVAEFENELVELNNWKCKKAYNKYLSKFLIKIFKADLLLNYIKTKEEFFFVIMHIDSIQERAFPFFYLNAKRKILFLFDAWESLFPKIVKVVSESKIDIVFTSAQLSAELLNNKSNSKNFFWMPEAIKSSNYKFLDIDKKDIDIIQIGRKYDIYHNKILEFTRKNKLLYLYEKIPGKIIFKGNLDFFNALARAKISICFPLSVTHPHKSGRISTMTRRYLESMASKCLIVGSLPDDMKLLFDYNPIIEANLDEPNNQLREILDNYSDYIPLIEKNYFEVNRKHQWKNRIEKINDIINKYY